MSIRVGRPPRPRCRARAARDPARAPVRTPRLGLPYTLTALACVLVVGLASASVSRRMAEDEAVVGAVTTTRMVAEAALRPVLTDDLLRGDPVALAGFDAVVRDRVLNVSLLRVKVWTADGRIAYSDEPRLIGRRFALDEADRAALDGGQPSAGVADLSGPENEFEDPAVGVLEVYLPLRTPGGTPALLEVYHRYDGVAETAQHAWLRSLPLVLGALLLLELLQVPIGIVLARRLRRSLAQREDLLRRALAAAEDERRRIAGDLHDGVVQDLAGVAFLLGAVARDGTPAPAGELADAAGRVRASVRSLRSLLVEIYPPNLHEAGLAAALSDLAAGLVPREIIATLQIDDPAPRLPRERTELVYRVAQEALRNVVRHAGATRVAVALHRADTGVELSVTDDGTGFDPTGLVDRPDHIGLRALAGLAGQWGASLDVRSAPGRGTTVRLELPR